MGDGVADLGRMQKTELPKTPLATSTKRSPLWSGNEGRPALLEASGIKELSVKLRRQRVSFQGSRNGRKRRDISFGAEFEHALSGRVASHPTSKVYWCTGTASCRLCIYLGSRGGAINSYIWKDQAMMYSSKVQRIGSCTRHTLSGQSQRKRTDQAQSG